MEKRPSCYRRFKKCKIEADGMVNKLPVCIGCLERGESVDFISFEK